MLLKTLSITALKETMNNISYPFELKVKKILKFHYNLPSTFLCSITCHECANNYNAQVYGEYSKPGLSCIDPRLIWLTTVRQQNLTGLPHSTTFAAYLLPTDCMQRQRHLRTNRLSSPPLPSSTSPERRFPSTNYAHASYYKCRSFTTARFKARNYPAQSMLESFLRS